MQYDVAVLRDQQAYKELFLLFYKPVTHFAMAIVRSKEEAEELYVDVMMKIWNLGEDLKNINDLKSYLLTITKNASLNYLDKFHKLHTTDIDILNDEQSGLFDPEQIFLHNELKEVIDQAVNALPPKCRMVYHLIKENKSSYREAAQIMDISIKTAERHMTIALQRIISVVEFYQKSGKD